MKTPRFICVLDPLGLWTVWDEHTGQPAERGAPQIALSEPTALAACQDLNLRDTAEFLPTGFDTGEAANRAATGCGALDRRAELPGVDP